MRTVHKSLSQKQAIIKPGKKQNLAVGSFNPDYIESLESVYDKIYTEGMFVLIAPSVLCAVVPVANIAVCLTYPGLAIYAFAKHRQKEGFFVEFNYIAADSLCFLRILHKY